MTDEDVKRREKDEDEKEDEAAEEEDEAAASVPPAAVAAAPAPAASDERSWGFPAFARDFPRHPELDALVTLFADGNYLAVRKDATRLAAKNDVSDEVKKAALVLRARVEPDRTARTFFALAAALLVFLTVWWVTHDGPEHRGNIPPPAAPAVEFVK